MAQSLVVAVIGSGVAGLVAARELRREGHRVVIFEKSDRVGGLWVYDPRVEPDPMGQDPGREIVHSSMYESLRTNLPRALMGFSDFDFEEREYGDPRDFPGHREVLEFLKDFATRFGIVELVRFNSEVERVERVDEGGDTWRVEWKKRDEDGRVNLEIQVFDAVVVCNGNYTVPKLADIPGIEKWPGKQTHSHNYRVPTPFKGQVVVVIGNGPSAFDISRDIRKVAKEVHLSSRSPHAKFSKLEHYHNIWQHSSIHMAMEDGTVEFEDKSSVQANVILHCTGYKYEYPFLNTNGIINIDDNRINPLYKHVFPPQLAPRLAFVSVPQKTIIFRLTELQSKWIARVLSGKAKLPSEEEMMDDVKQYYQQMVILNRPIHLTHFPLNLDEYMDYLAAQAGAVPLEDWRRQIFREILKCAQNGQDEFRDDVDFSKWHPSTSIIAL